jgi:hypothetical protein
MAEQHRIIVDSLSGICRSHDRAEASSRAFRRRQGIGLSDELIAQARAPDILAMRKAAEWKAKADQLDRLNAKKMEKVRAAKGLPDSATPTVRLSNYTQLMDKVIQVASSNRVGSKAGRGDELSYQRTKRIKEIKRDMEARLTGNYASAAGAAGTARECAGFEAWIQTNKSRGTGGSSTAFSGGVQAAATDGTQRAFDESMLKTVLASCADNGGEPSLVLMGSFNKQAASTFDGIAQQRRDTGDKMAVIVAGADVYVHDFGRINMVYSQFSRTRSALVVDPDMWKLCYYQPFKVEDLAKTGHSDRQLLSVEFTLEACNELASGVVADLTTS